MTSAISCPLWSSGLGLGFTNPVGTGGVWDVCLY